MEPQATGTVSRFYTERSWIEGAAEEQLAGVARLDGVVSVAGFPDLHPGKNGPVGMAAVSRRLHPHLIGNDIGCGFGFYDLGIPVRKLRVDKAEARLRAVAFDADPGAAERLESLGLPGDLYPSALGSIGGGNHFAELQAVHETFSEDGAPDGGNVHLLVHTGSRSYGAALWDEFQERTGRIHDGLDPDTDIGREWIARQDECLRWAALNRLMIAERIADALRAEISSVRDMPHNLVRETDGAWHHYKGATALRPGEIAPVAGSRDSLSHLVRGAPGLAASGYAVAHGAGRKYDRASMHHREGKTRSDREALTRNQWGGHIVCDDAGLLVEEAGSAYKNPRHVIDDMAAFGLVEPVCSLRPLLTYKKAVETDPSLARKRSDRDARDNRRNRR